MKHTMIFLFFFVHAAQMFPQWIQQQLPAPVDVWGLASKDSVIFAGTEIGFQMPGYVFKSTDFGVTWDTLTGLPFAGGWSFAYSDPMLIAGSFGWGMYLSGDLGETWAVPDSGISPNENVHVIINHGHYFFAATAGSGNGIFRSSDKGRKWISVNEGLLELSFLSLVSNGQDLYAGTAFTGEVYRSTDDGMTWFYAGSGLPLNSNVATLAAIGENVYAGLGSGQGVYCSRDKGLNWKNISSPFFTGQVWAVVLSDTTLIAGTIGGGVLLTQDNGQSWKSVNEGLTNLNIRSLIVSDKGYIFAGTTNGFVCYRLLSEIITGLSEPDNLAAAFELQQNFPNPFNPVTKIKFNIGKNSYVVLTVYDILGEEVETLVAEEKPAGNYEISWNAGSRASGVFFYQLRAGEFIKTNKMILAK